jgi:hypothetical protein
MSAGSRPIGTAASAKPCTRKLVLPPVLCRYRRGRSAGRAGGVRGRRAGDRPRRRGLPATRRKGSAVSGTAGLSDPNGQGAGARSAYGGEGATFSLNRLRRSGPMRGRRLFQAGQVSRLGTTLAMDGDFHVVRSESGFAGCVTNRLY